MIEISRLFEKLTLFSCDIKSEVENFIDFLKSKSQSKEAIHFPKFGSGSGLFITKEDFDEPLDDFKEYMS